ncbi:hypothetical protein ACP4OV_018191 [Aristida adscensionis]
MVGAAPFHGGRAAQGQCIHHGGHHTAIRDMEELNKDFIVRDSCSRTLCSSWEAGGPLSPDLLGP